MVNETTNASSLHAWFVVAAGFTVVFFGFGCYYTFPVFYPAMIAEFGWSRSQIAGAGSLALLVSGILSPFVGMLADRRGPRSVVALGVLVAAVAMLTLSRSHNLETTYLAFAVFGIGMSGSSLMVMQMLMAQWFDRRRGLATGLVIAGMGLGGSVAPLLLTPLLGHSGWRVPVLSQGVTLLAVGLPATLLMRRRNPRTRSPVESASAGPVSGIEYAVALRTRNFWLMAMAALLSMAAAGSVLQHLVLFLREQTISLNLASRALSLMLLSSVVGRLALGTLSDIFTRRRALMTAYALLSVGLVLMALAHSTPVYIAAAIFVGLGYGGSVVMMTLSSAELFGLRSLGRILGTIVFFFTLGGAIGPVVIGALADHGFGYRQAFLLLAVVTVVGLACAALLRATPQPISLSSEQETTSA